MAARRKAARLNAALAQRLRLLVLDCDGVLTDGALYFGASGEQLKVFHVRDGHGIKQVQAAGIEVAVISGRRSPALSRRCRELGIRHLYQGVADKSAALDVLLRKLKLSDSQTACVGDDTPDVALFKRAALAVADYGYVLELGEVLICLPAAVSEPPKLSPSPSAMVMAPLIDKVLLVLDAVKLPPLKLTLTNLLDPDVLS